MFCDISPGTGHNNATRGLVQALETLGYTTETLHLVGAVSASFDYLHDPDWLSKYLYASWQETETVNLVHLNPGLVGDFWTKDRLNIAYCAWETDALPKAVLTINDEDRSVVGDLNKYDQIWVPTAFLVSVFKESGVTVPIHVVPHALQNELLERPLKPFPPLPPTVFYTVGAWNARKDLEGLLRAYLTSGWTITSPVKLLMHAVPHNRDQGSIQSHQIVAHEAAKGLVASLAGGAPPFGLLTMPKKYSNVLDLHENSHVFVSMSHGEGFGLGILEALALGRVVIGGGPWLDGIDVPTLIRLPMTKAPITPMPECRGYELTQQWWSTSPADMTRAMLVQFASMPDDCQAAATKIRVAYSPEAIGQVVKPLLGAY
jgi:glycosyltransferase involved in cell wall biosynthesis